MTTQAACSQCGRLVDSGAQFCAHCGTNVSAAQDHLSTRHVSSGNTAQLQDLLLQRLRHATLGEYEILTEIGKGGMATVYLGHDLQLDRKVAVKVMLPSLLEGEGMIDRFKLEARTAAQLSHPHIIPIYAVRDEDDLLFFIMKFIEGRPLDSIAKEVGQMPVQMAQSILAKVGEALGYAHRRGVVHRDIKPANLMIDVEGLPIVTDFGIAKVADKRGLTMTGATIGTPTYMSPEQCEAGAITGASDQYSLGIVAYEMLSGHLPFQSDSIVSLLYKHVHEPPAPFMEQRPDMLPALHDAVMRMLAKNPEDRFPTMEAAVEAIGNESLAYDDPMRSKLIELAKQGANLTILKRVSTPRSQTPVRSRAATKRAAAARSRVGTAAAQAASAPTVRGQAAAPTVVVQRSRAPLWIGLAVLALAAGGAAVWKPWQRGNSGTGVAVTGSAIRAMAIEPATAALVVDDNMQLTATAQDSAGQPVGTTVAWTSENAAVATVSGTGLVHAVAPGTVNVHAAAGGVTATSVLTISAPVPTAPGTPPSAVARIRMGDVPPTLAAGGTLQLTAMALDERGVNMRERQVSWSTSAPTVALVSRSGQVTALSPGEVTFTARSGTASEAVTLHVVPPRGPAPGTVHAASVALSSTGPLAVGANARLSATVMGDDGRPMNTPVSWRSADQRIATVTEGVVTAVSAGSTVITASADGREGSTSITVEAPARPTSAPPPAPPAATESNPREDIAAVVQDYARAIESRQVSEVRRVYPGLSSDQENGLAQFWRNTDQLQVHLRMTSVDIQGDVANATVGGEWLYFSRDSRRNERLAQNLRVALERGPSGWRIRSVR